MTCIRYLWGKKRSHGSSTCFICHKVRESYTVNTAFVLCFAENLLPGLCDCSECTSWNQLNLEYNADSDWFLQQDCLLDFSGIDIILISNYHFMLALPFITEVSFDLFTFLLVHIWKHIYTRTSWFLLVGETNCSQRRNITKL